MKKEVIRLSAINYLPHFMSTEDGGCIGLDCLLLGVLGEVLGFDVEFKKPPDGKWGTLINGTWNGMFGQLARNEADVALGSFYNPARFRDNDFTNYYHFDNVFFLSPAPRPEPQWLSIIKPFHWLVWILIAATLFLSGLVYWLMHKRRISFDPESEHHTEFGKVLMNVIKQICNEPIIILPSSHSLRAALMSIMIFCMIILLMYSGTLTSFLINPAYKKTIETFDDLFSSGMNWGIRDAGGSEKKIYWTEEGYLWNGMQFYKSMDECFGKVIKEELVCLELRNPMMSWYGRQTTEVKSKLRLSTSTMYHVPKSIVLRKNYPYTKRVAQIIDRMVESGLVQKWLREASNGADEKSFAIYAHQENIEGSIILSLKHLTGAFYLLGLGVGCSLLAFAVEMFVGNR